MDAAFCCCPKASRPPNRTDYQTKLRGATPEEAATQIEKLTSLLADTQKSLNEIKSNARPRG